MYFFYSSLKGEMKNYSICKKTVETFQYQLENDE